jgi:hypothetical protein
MSIPEIRPVNLYQHQLVADKLRQGASMLQGMPEVVTLLNIGADNIESLCDVVKAQERLAAELRGLIIGDDLLCAFCASPLEVFEIDYGLGNRHQILCPDDNCISNMSYGSRDDADAVLALLKAGKRSGS